MGTIDGIYWMSRSVYRQCFHSFRHWPGVNRWNERNFNTTRALWYPEPDKFRWLCSLTSRLKCTTDLCRNYTLRGWCESFVSAESNFVVELIDVVDDSELWLPSPLRIVIFILKSLIVFFFFFLWWSSGFEREFDLKFEFSSWIWFKISHLIILLKIVLCLKFNTTQRWSKRIKISRGAGTESVSFFQAKGGKGMNWISR